MACRRSVRLIGRAPPPAVARAAQCDGRGGRLRCRDDMPMCLPDGPPREPGRAAAHGARASSWARRRRGGRDRGARRELLLRVHRRRLRREDLEDCYSQATLELLRGRARRAAVSPAACTSPDVLEQRFLSRVLDRRRALLGRSPHTGGARRGVLARWRRASGSGARRPPRRARPLVAAPPRAAPDCAPGAAAHGRPAPCAGLARSRSASGARSSASSTAGRTRSTARSPGAPARGCGRCWRRSRGTGCPTLWTGSEERYRDTPMLIPHHPHRRVPGDAAGRSQARPRGGPVPRARGRRPGVSPPWPPVAGVVLACDMSAAAP